MFLKICFLLLFISPVIAYSQSIDEWKLCFNKKEVASSRSDSIATIKVKHDTKAALKFVLPANDTAFIRKIIVMTTAQNGIDSKQLSTGEHDVIFNPDELYTQANGSAVSFYIVKLPADPAKAMLVRIAPRLICNLQWTN